MSAANDMNDIVYIYITAPDEATAKGIARHLVEKQLIACANIFPITSVYRWEGKIEEGAEVVMIAKTLPSNYDEVRREVASIHPYSVPCIVQLPARANEAYFQWMEESVRKDEG